MSARLRADALAESIRSMPEGVSQERIVERAQAFFDFLVGNDVETGRRRVLNDIDRERHRQIQLGWTSEHDREHGTHHLVSLAKQYAHKSGEAGPGLYSRERLVQAAALLTAAIEAMDQRERRAQ